MKAEGRNSVLTAIGKTLHEDEIGFFVLFLK